MSQDEENKSKMMMQMNSTAGFNMALKMSKEGTFGHDYGGVQEQKKP